MNESNFAELEKLFLALGDKTRLKLLMLMADGPVSVGFLADALVESQPKVSRHLAYLKNAGVVYARRDGKWIYYGIREQDWAGAANILNTVRGSIASEQGVNTTSARKSDELHTAENIYAKVYKGGGLGPDANHGVDEREELPIFLL